MARLYDTAAWAKLRARQLQAFPLCKFCIEQGFIVAASVVDHIEPHKNNSDLFFDSSNLQSLCKHCHDSHKQRLEKTGRIIGASVTGEPINPSSHWHK